MHLHTRNVNTAFRTLVETFAGGGTPKPTPENWDPDYVPVVKRPSRNGNVLMIDEPVTITYSHPRERVLFNPARDANPFFHLYEALWMLAGRNDVAPLAYYASNMANYSDDGKTLNGAYGYRWRHALDNSVVEADQITVLVDHLKADPNSRRAVLQMWNVEDDLLKIGGPLTIEAFLNAEHIKTEGSVATMRREDFSKDVCCNLSVMFSLREGDERTKHSPIDSHRPIRLLDMTVTNRSNDMIWGMLGANYVHFTFLQEYMACRLGVEVGVYHHFTNNLHVYESNWKPEKWLNSESYLAYDDNVATAPLLVADPAQFDKEVKQVVEVFAGPARGDLSISEPLRSSEPFLRSIALPAFMSFGCHKQKDKGGALYWADRISAGDWRIACINWLKRRYSK